MSQSALSSSPPRRFRFALLIVERLLLVVACASLGYYAWVTIQAKRYQAAESRALEMFLAAQPPAGAATVPVRRERPAYTTGSPLGRIEIPRLHMSVVMRNGSDADTLTLAVGHIPGTAFPGDPGNVGLAGHRDTFFRPLRDVRMDDEIVLVTREGRFTYRVTRTHVVEPNDVWVLDPTEEPSLTLVTCFPFNYVGSAPHRFIVHATLASAS
jgi:sortase A